MTGFDGSLHESTLANVAAVQPNNAFESPSAYGRGIRAESQLETQNTPTRMFSSGTEITDRMLDDLALSADQLRLERNLIFRDINPHAFFNDPNLEAAINQITGTKGDPANPANQATKTEAHGRDLEKVEKLAKYEATARIEDWRRNNPDLMSDASIPAGLANNEIACASQTGVQDAINDLYARRGFPFSGRALQQLYRQLRDYQPNPRFSDADFTVEERNYLNRLAARRSEFKALDH